MSVPTRTVARTIATLRPVGAGTAVARRQGKLAEPRVKLVLLRIGHVDELELRRVAPGGRHSPFDRVGQLSRRRVPGGRNGDDHLGTALAGPDRAKQPQLSDAVEQAWVDDGADGLFQGRVGIGHRPAAIPVIQVLASRLLLTCAGATGTIKVWVKARASRKDQ